MEICSIFNDVLGPVMTGPSSSHSAGCARIGKTARILYGKDIYRADIVFEEQGSYPSTYIGQGSSFGFIGGLLGYATDDSRLRCAVELAKEMGRDFRFRKADLGFKHPNQARIDVFDGDGNVALSLMTFSIGGGMFRITEMDGFPVEINGENRQAFICCDAPGTKVEEALRLREMVFHKEAAGSQILFALSEPSDPEVELLENLWDIPGVRYVRIAEPVLPVIKRQNAQVPFATAEEALKCHKKTGADLWELAIRYECAFGVLTEEDVWTLAEHTLEVMRNASVPPDPSTTEMFGFLPYRCREMQKTFERVKTVDAGVLNQTMFAAISVMENSCAHQIVAAAPTAGSSGVLPAAVVAVGDALGLGDREIEKGLLAAGLTGAFIGNQATFGGEVGACQAEIGSSAAMAAAGIVQMLGGTVLQGFRAASMTMQNLLGLVCDPVAGLTEIPCISRNVAAVSNAVLSANMAMLGFDPVIPLDETICAMGDVGKALPASLRCTCEGGLCKTPTGCRIGQRIDEQRPTL